MIVTFTPAEGESRVYEYKPRKLMSVEAEAIEKRIGKPYDSVVEDIIRGSALARRALLFTFEKRAHPTLAWDAFDFPVDAVEIDFDAEEIAELRAAIEAAPLPEDERAQALAVLEQMKPVESTPKAPEPSSETST